MGVEMYSNLALESLPRPMWPAAAFTGLLVLIARARRAIERGDVPAAHSQLVQAQTVVAILKASIRPDGGEVGRNLASLYDYTLGELAQANIRKDAERLDQLVPVLTPVRDGWEEAGRAVLAAAGPAGRVAPGEGA